MKTATDWTIPLHPDLRDLKGSISLRCAHCRDQGRKAAMLVVQIGDLRDTDPDLDSLAGPEIDLRYCAVGVVEAKRRTYSAVRGADGAYRGSSRDGNHFEFDAETWGEWSADAPHQDRVRWLDEDTEWPLSPTCHRCGRTERIGRKRIAKLLYDAAKAGTPIFI